MRNASSAPPCQRVIRSVATGRYLVQGGIGAWVDSPKDATAYDTLIEMVEVCRLYGLEDVELIYRTSPGGANAAGTSIETF